jgi:hypothetical protein
MLASHGKKSSTLPKILPPPPFAGVALQGINSSKDPYRQKQMDASVVMEAVGKGSKAADADEDGIFFEPEFKHTLDGSAVAE